MSNDWRVDSHDRQIEELQDGLREAKEKIWALERRPSEWLFKATMVIWWILIAAIWINAIIEIAHKH